MVMVCLIAMVAPLYAQRLVDTMVVNEVFEERSLQEVIRYMQRKYDLKVAYESQLVREIKVNTVIRDANVDEAWEQILEGTGLTHQFLGDGKKVREIQSISVALPILLPVSSAIAKLVKPSPMLR